MARCGPMANPFQVRFPPCKAPIPRGVHLSDQPVWPHSPRFLSATRIQPAKAGACNRRDPAQRREENAGIAPTFQMKPLATAGLLLVLCLVSVAQESDTTFKVDVKLVNVFVTVTDEHGAPIAALKKDNFQLREDGQEQKIAVFDKESALPLSIVLAIDTSLSTRKDLPLELASARRFAHAILRPVDALSLYQFSEIVNEVVPFTSDLGRIDRGIDRIRMGAATALYDALFLGSQA